jgi:GTP-binding protein
MSAPGGDRSPGGDAPPAAVAPSTATVAIVGRPNVGKSTLFNRLLGRRQAIVHDTPGVTRDRITGTVELGEGRRLQLVDTGGLVPGEDPLGLNEQVLLAVEESELLLLVVDGKQGLVPADEEVWRVLRRSGRPTVLVVNKGDTKAAQQSFDEFYRLGVGTQVLVSAEHGGGLEELIEAILDQVPLAPSVESSAPGVAIVGRPNVGKSSLVNHLLGEARSLVSPTAGTTRDPVDSMLRIDGRELVLIDTAGIRRRAKVADAPEELAVMMARRQIERAEVAVLVVDAADGVHTGDLAIAGTIWELGRAAVVAMNKWDLLAEESRTRLEEGWERLAGILSAPPRVNLSAFTGRGVAKLLPAVEQALARFHTQVPTSELNRLLEEATERHGAPAHRGRPWTFYYATQVSTAPPTFMLFANRSLPRGHTYRRYLENRLRYALDLDGVPIRLVIRSRRQGRSSGSVSR